MAPDFKTSDDIFRNRVQQTFTLSEAVELMKLADKYITPFHSNIRWVDARTKKPVSIGYSSSPYE